LIGIPKLLNLSPIKYLEPHYPRPYIIEITRQELQKIRDSILASTEINEEKININPAFLAEKIAHRIRQRFEQSVAPAINATGIILHTALGRAPLCEAAQEAISLAIKNYCTIAINRETGKRGDRYSHVEELRCYLTGAEAACVVNNNAAATMLVLNTLAFQKEVIISRGQLIEIGGSFRIPDVMQRSQAHMIEVGTTNKTH
jgi:L-seryl-tRNA(Ser) seleniumtransferase